MASAWGSSFGAAWASAWGAITTGGGLGDDKKKKKFFIEQGGKLLVFNTAQQAVNADKPKAKTEISAPVKSEPEQVISLPAVKEYAQVIGQIEQYNAAYNSKHFEQLIALFEQMREEEELEALLLAL